jgi:hypothetical protein
VAVPARRTDTAATDAPAAGGAFTPKVTVAASDSRYEILVPLAVEKVRGFSVSWSSTGATVSLDPLPACFPPVAGSRRAARDGVAHSVADQVRGSVTSRALIKRSVNAMAPSVAITLLTGGPGRHRAVRRVPTAAPIVSPEAIPVSAHNAATRC